MKEERIVVQKEQPPVASWGMNGIDRAEAKRFDMKGKVEAMLNLLEVIDDIALDISITIRNKAKVEVI